MMLKVAVILLALSTSAWTAGLKELLYQPKLIGINPRAACPQLAPACTCESNPVEGNYVNCQDFQDFQQLNFEFFNQLSSIYFSSIKIEPESPIVVNSQLDLTGLENYQARDFDLSYIKGFDIKSNPFEIFYDKDEMKSKGLRLLRLSLSYSKMDFYKDDELLDNELECNNDFFTSDEMSSQIKLFEVVTDLYVGVGMTYTQGVCPFLFKNAQIDRMRVFNQHTNRFRVYSLLESLEQQAGGDDEKLDELYQQTVNDLNININSYYIYNSQNVRLDNSFLDPFLLANIKELFIIRSSLVEINAEIFKSFGQLKQVSFDLTNTRQLVNTDPNQNAWISSLNQDIFITDLNDCEYIEANKYNRALVSFDETLSQDPYDYPDEDFCQFKYFPHRQLVFPYIVQSPRIPVKCTCTLLFLIQNWKIFPSSEFESDSIAECREAADFNEKIAQCDFPARLRNCPDSRGIATKLTWFEENQINKRCFDGATSTAMDTTTSESLEETTTPNVPLTTTDSPKTTAVPGSSTTMVSGTTTAAIPGFTTTGIPGTTSTSVPDTTTKMPVTTTIVKPGTTTTLPGTTTAAVPDATTTTVPGTTMAQGTTTAGIPESTTTKTTVPVITTTEMPGTKTKTVPPTTMVPGTTTSGIPRSTTTGMPDVTTTIASGTTTAGIPGTTTVAMPGTTMGPGIATTTVSGTIIVPVSTSSAMPGTNSTTIQGTTTIPAINTTTTTTTTTTTHASTTPATSTTTTTTSSTVRTTTSSSTPQTITSSSFSQASSTSSTTSRPTSSTATRITSATSTPSAVTSTRPTSSATTTSSNIQTSILTVTRPTTSKTSNRTRNILLGVLIPTGVGIGVGVGLAVYFYFFRARPVRVSPS